MGLGQDRSCFMMVEHSQQPTQKNGKLRHIQILQIRSDMITKEEHCYNLQRPLYLTRQRPNFLFKSRNVLDGASAVQPTTTIPWHGLLRNFSSGWKFYVVAVSYTHSDAADD